MTIRVWRPPPARPLHCIESRQWSTDRQERDEFSRPGLHLGAIASSSGNPRARSNLDLSVALPITGWCQAPVAERDARSRLIRKRDAAKRSTSLSRPRLKLAAAS